MNPSFITLVAIVVATGVGVEKFELDFRQTKLVVIIIEFCWFLPPKHKKNLVLSSIQCATVLFTQRYSIYSLQFRSCVPSKCPVRGILNILRRGGKLTMFSYGAGLIVGSH